MLNKKILFGAILSMAVLFTACSNSAPEISETVSHTVTTSADVTEATETTSAETTSAASETATTETEAIDISGVEYMKEALKIDWENSAASKDTSGASGMTAAELYAVDLNGDGVKELFVNYSFGAGIDGFVCVYDVSDGVKKLYDISARIWADKAELYTDTDGNVHFILANGYSTWNSTYDYAFFDITYNNIKIPFYIDDYQYHNEVGHVFKSDIYTNCEVVPNIETFKGWRNFDPEKAEYIDRFDADYVIGAIDNGENNEISELVQKEVYEGLTYVSDIDMIYENSGYDENDRVVWDFEDFWQQAAPKLAEVYSETASTESIDISGVDYIKEALQAEWNNSEYDRYAVSVVNLYTADLNGDGTKELFVNYSFGAAMNGLVYVYDVSDGMKKLYEISSRMWAEKSELYKDESGTLHLIRKEGYAGGIGEMDNAYFDITYDSIKMPIYINEYDWYDGGAHLLAYDIYKNCKFVPLNFINRFSGWRNFDPEKAEYIGRFDTESVRDAFDFDSDEKNEVREIIQKEVYEGLTYVSDIDMIYENSGYGENYRVVWDFEDFWQEAAPKLAEIYGN